MELPQVEIPALSDAGAPLIVEFPEGERAAVLVVDDNPGVLASLAAVIAGLNVDVVKAASGREALRSLLTRDFALILLDVNMPRMDGYETAQLIRARPRSANTPLIFVTAYSTADAERLKGYTAGAADYLLAPVLPEILRAKVKFFVERYYRNLILRRQASELERRAEEIARQNLLLEIASRMKSEFLANMSHELRTPLNAVLGFAEVLRRGSAGKLAPKQRDYVEEIHTSGQHLLALINDILDLSKVETGKMDLELDRTNIAMLVHAGLVAVQERAVKHRIALKTTASAEPGELVVDPRKAKQIVYNLLSNAVKFTPDGGEVRVAVRSVKRPEIRIEPAPGFAARVLPLANGGFDKFVEIAVSDTGIGIAAADLERLFQVFTRLESGLAQANEGTGLGLALVQRFAALHGGTVGVSSAPGKGSTFFVWLPWRDTIQPAAQAPSEGQAAQ